MDGEGAGGAGGQPLGGRPEDRSKCEAPPPAVTQPHCERGTRLSATCASYPVCKELPGVGVLGLKDLVLKDFNGLIHLKILGKQVRLVARAAEQEEGRTANVCEHGCHKDTDTMVLRLKLKDYKLAKFEKEFVKCIRSGQCLEPRVAETQVMTLPAGLSTMSGPSPSRLACSMPAHAKSADGRVECCTFRKGRQRPPRSIPRLCATYINQHAYEAGHEPDQGVDLWLTGHTKEH